MKYLSLLLALVVTVPAYAGQTRGPSDWASTVGQGPTWEQLMDQARRAAEGGNAIDLIVEPLGVFVFYNNPRPFCYTYMVPGAWKAARGAQDGREARSKDERAFVWVQMMTAQALESVEGASLVERVAAMITRMYEQNLGQTLTGVEVIPFESAGPATWKWKAATAGFMIGGQYYRIPARFIVDLSPHAVMHLTVDGTQDNDRVARGSSNPYERP